MRLAERKTVRDRDRQTETETHREQKRDRQTDTVKQTGRQAYR